MKMTDSALDRMRRYYQDILPLEPMHGWRSSRDEGGHTHCECCCATIYRNDPVVGRDEASAKARAKEAAQRSTGTTRSSAGI